MKKVRELISDALYWVSYKVEALAFWVEPPFKFTKEQEELRKQWLEKFGDLDVFEPFKLNDD